MMDLECSDDVYAIVLSPTNPNVMITGHSKGELHVWNIADSTHVKLDGHTDAITSLCMSADGRLLCSTSYFGVICCHDLLHGNTLLWQKDLQEFTIRSNIVYHEGCFMILGLDDIFVLNALTGDHEKSSSECAEYIAVLYLRKIGLLYFDSPL